MVAACSECAEKYNQNVAPALTEADVEQRLAEFKQNYGKKVRKPIRTNWVRKAAIIAAAAVLTCMLTLTVAAKAYGFKNIGEFVVYAVNNLFPGESVDENKITYIFNGETIIYDSVEDWCKAENKKIMYPSVLPHGLYIKQITRNDNNGATFWIFVLNEDTLTIRINNYLSLDTTGTSWVKQTTSSGLTYSVIHERQAVYQTDDYEYIIQSECNEYLQIIMEGMKTNEE